MVEVISSSLIIPKPNVGYIYNQNGNRAFFGLKTQNPTSIIIYRDYSESIPWLGQGI
ncbi:hypothetical protein E2542_SST19414 [Spatholobus suberectus]|nr:hypothetical protein E2542_SST19414 [Spatholobus suberectus]